MDPSPPRPPRNPRWTLGSRISRAGLRHGVAHPVALAALLGLALNDHIFKVTHPSILTGKLSDVCWLVVMPLVVSALLSMTRLPSRAIRWLSIGGVGLAFVLLQLWPALGNTWVAWFGGSHTADPTDLLALPALALVPIAWTRRRRSAVVILPVALVFSLATSYGFYRDWDRRYPCDGAVDWPPGQPLVIDGMYTTDLAFSTEAFQRAVSVQPVGGEPHELEFVTADGLVGLCVVGGLTPSTDYEWTVGPFESDSYNAVPVPALDVEGTWFFTTGALSDGSDGSCVSLLVEAEHEPCDWEPVDTGLTPSQTLDTGAGR